MVGKSEKRKGIEILIKAFGNEFKNGATDVCLYMRSSLTPAQKKTLKKYPQVRFGILPSVSDSDLVAGYQAADVFVLTTHGEGWGRPVMEAMAGGTPVIVPYWSGMTEFVDPDSPLTIKIDSLEQAFQGQPWFIGGKENAKKHQWAKISESQVREKLRWATDNRDQLGELGEKDRRRMMASYTRDNIARDAVERLQTIWNSLK